MLKQCLSLPLLVANEEVVRLFPEFALSLDRLEMTLIVVAYLFQELALLSGQDPSRSLAQIVIVLVRVRT